MPHGFFFQRMQEINDLTLLAEETLAELQRKTEELKELYRKHQEQFPNPAFLIDPSNRRQPRR